MAAASIFMPEAINSPGYALDRAETHFFSEIYLLPSFSLRFFSPPNTKNHSKKHIKVSWFFFLNQEHKVLLFYLIFLSLVLHFGFGV